LLKVCEKQSRRKRKRTHPTKESIGDPTRG
jgi:hypothetical protein